ncbi:MAG: hypothetical protein MJZ78_05915, partial [Bacteroidales bacterium]|nr:hypothetical protein [Bacteroidales bacterium]
MYKIKHVIFLFAVLAASLLSHAQSTDLPDFTDLDDPAVTCYWGEFLNPKQHKERDEYLHQVITEQGHDYWIDELPLLPPGEDRVVKLGDFDETGFNYNRDAEAISYQFTVDPNRSILLLKFAVVLQDPGDTEHDSLQRPRFKVRVTDLDDVLVDDCAVYDVTAYGHVPGFIPGDNKIIWRPWTSVGIDLTPYSGREIRVEFTTYDCALGEHFGYAYYTAQCISNKFQVENCTNPITLKAPDFFESYLWNTGSTEQSETFLVPENTPVDVSCLVTSVTGCQFTLYGRLAYDDGMPTEDTEIYDTACIRSWYNDNYFNFMTGDTPGDMPPVINTIVNLSSGCSTVNITLHLHLIDRVPDNHIFMDICDGEEFHDLNFDITSDMLSPGENVFSHDDLSPSGCDSTTVLHLFVNNSYNLLFSEQACSGDSYSGHGFLIENTKTGVLDSTLNLSTSAGCDSIVTLHLLVNPSHNIVLYDNICIGNTYDKNGFHIDNAEAGLNTYTQTYTTDSGCDSIRTLNLFVNDTINIVINDTICHGENYDKYNFNIIDPAVGTTQQEQQLISSSGCDSVVKLNLFVAPTYRTDIYDTVCEGGSYHQNGVQWDSLEAGTRYDTIVMESIFGCDSLIFIKLTVTPKYTEIIFDTICNGSEYHNYGFDTIPESPGDITIQKDLISSFGCDSIVILNLYVSPAYNNEIYDEICYGDSYHKYNFDTISPGLGTIVMRQELLSSDGCDSIVVLNLSVKEVLHNYLKDTICEGEDYHGYGFHFYNPGIGIHHDSVTLTSVVGCDSIVTLELLVAQIHDVTIHDTLCFGEDYHKYDFHFIGPIAGDHNLQHDILSGAGCDSTVRLFLHVDPSYLIDHYDTVCSGEEYHNLGFDLTDLHAGWNSDSLFFSLSSGCDSISVINIFVAEKYDTLFFDTICQGETYSNHGFYLDSLEHGWNYDTLKLESIFGCDSIVRLQLNVFQSDKTLISDTICFGENYTEYNFNLMNPAVGTHNQRQDLVNIIGCDSVVELTLSVMPLFDTLLFDTICFGDDYDKYGFIFSGLETGEHTDTLELKSIFGCDSIVVIDLMVNETPYTNIIDTICFGEIYTENGFTIDSLEAGLHLDTLRLNTILGCDSIVCLELTVAPKDIVEIYDTTCTGFDYHENNFHYLNPQVGHHTLLNEDPSSFGCDSTTILHLQVYSAYELNFFDTICFGEDYDSLGFSFESPEVGWHFDTLNLLSVFGCDSIVTMSLIIGDVSDINITDTICHGDAYDAPGFLLDSLDVGWHFDTLNLLSALGCDSTVTLELYVAPTYSFAFADTLCFGEEYHMNGFDLDSLNVGWNFDTLNLETTLGCDSISTLALYVAPIYNIALFDTICFGEDYDSLGFSF